MQHKQIEFWKKISVFEENKTNEICYLVFLIFCDQITPPPEFLEKRLQLWNKLKLEYDSWVAAQAPQPIKITLPDGKIVEGESWKTTPYQVASGIRFVVPPFFLSLFSQMIQKCFKFLCHPSGKRSKIIRNLKLLSLQWRLEMHRTVVHWCRYLVNF